MRIGLEDAAWTIAAVGGAAVPSSVRGRAVPVSVPGCAYGAMIAAGIVRHPDDGDGERDGAWIGRTDWRMATRLPDDGGTDASLAAHDELDLVIDGLDTLATVRLGAAIVGAAGNMHRPQRFSLHDAWRAGARDLAIDLAAPLPFVEAEERRLGARPLNGEGAFGAYPLLRKMACNFGWDWGPKVPTAGIWGGARLEAWSVVRIDAVVPRVVALDADAAEVEIDVHLAWSRHAAAGEAATLQVRLDGPDGTTVAEGTTVAAPGTDRCTLRLGVASPVRWWPRGHGAPALHGLRASVTHPARRLGAGAAWQGRVGLRTRRLRTERDAHGTSFVVEVNGAPIFATGANWIPPDLLPGDPRARAARVRALLAAFVDAGGTMLRVWGGGTYESDDFHDACDELGILVFQDAMLACGLYPEDEPLRSEIARETEAAVKRLAHHPCIVLWCGGNENILAYESWGWKPRLAPGLSWGRAYYHEIIPAAVRGADPSMPFWPDSPWSGDEARHPNDPDHGDRHTWDLDLEACRRVVPRFASEFGHQSPSCAATLRRAGGSEALAWDGPALAHRQRAWDGGKRWYDDAFAARLGRLDGFAPHHLAAQLLQARALRLQVEWHRANAPRCMGSLLWQWNDVWAGHSWSVIDVDGRRKPAWWAVRAAWSPRLVTIQPREPTRPGHDFPPTAELDLVLVNDTDAPWTAACVVRAIDGRGTVLACGTWHATVPARSSRRTPLRQVLPEAPDRAIVIVDETGGASTASPPGRAVWLPGVERELGLGPVRWTIDVTEVPRDDGATDAPRRWRIDACPDRLALDAVLRRDRLASPGPAVSSIDLQPVVLPGESFTLFVDGARPDADAVRAAIGCMNELV